uniref:Peptidyl-tRNA hydrolase n=1 Tax=Geobacter metallireducens TaxID=28232 RepID=A0A831XKZ5_GEOME
MATRLIIGLGNPGPKYQWTRHNAGFMVLDHLSRVMGVAVAKKSFSGLYGEGSWHGDRLLLLKPQTFMNLSGRSAAEALRFHKLTHSDLIVIHDDLDIPFGRVKIKEGGGHGGHNGLRSLMQELGGGDFVRIRVGVGRPVRGDAADYVLANFSPAEMAGLPTLLDGVVDLIGELVRNGLPRTMSLYNNKDFLPAA